MTTKDTTIAMRRCVGSTRFGIEAHEAPENEFPAQPSAKDGLGRMCHTHWRQYTNALRKAAVARKAEEPGEPAERARSRPRPRPTSTPSPPRWWARASPSRRRRRAGPAAPRPQAEPEADAA